MTKKKKKTKKARGDRNTKEHGRATIGNRITKLFTSNKKRLTTRDIWTALNRGKKANQQVSIAGVRVAVRKLIDQKALKVVKTERKMFILQKGR